MAKQAINIGTLANDGTGDTLRAALDKCNDNFDEIYALTDGTGAASVLTLAAGSTTLGDTTISDATPILIFKDSSCTDADDNATILVAATDTGTGAEDIDVTFTQQVAGAATNWLVSDADGSITLGDATRGIVLSGAVTSGDATISDATPQLSFRDSSCAVARDNAYILVAATDVGDGTEDADVTLYQHVAGSAVAFLTSDADGSLTVGRSGQAIVLNGAVGDVVMKDSTPVLSMIDTDAVDGDAGVSITAACTTTTAGAEHVDATFAQQVSGSPVNFLVADADGLVTLGDGTRRIALNGKLDGDVTIYDATPVLTLIDSDTTDKDAGVAVSATATATGAGAENVDLAITQQVSGSPANVLVADADGSITLGDGTRAIVLAGAATVGDITLSDATPVLNFKDSSCAVADVNAYIEATATDVGDGSEDIDVTFAQQVAGTATNFLVADADGSITLGDATRGIVLSGAVTSGDVTISDATPVLNFKDSNCAVSDVNAYIEAVATDTGDGSEDVDVYIYQQVAGTAVACFTADADGSVVVGYNGQPAVLSSTTITGSSPTLAMKDTDCSDTDVNFDIVIAATDTGSGAEDIDVTMSAQVAGTKVAFLSFNADGPLTLGYGGQPVYIAKLQSLVTVTPNTGAATPANTDSGTVYTNEGDADGSSVTLPTAVAGLQFTIYVQAGQTITVTAGADDTIRIGSSVTAAAGSITSATVGSSLTLVAINAVEWVATASVGSWSFS